MGNLNAEVTMIKPICREPKVAIAGAIVHDQAVGIFSRSITAFSAVEIRTVANTGIPVKWHFQVRGINAQPGSLQTDGQTIVCCSKFLNLIKVWYNRESRTSGSPV